MENFWYNCGVISQTFEKSYIIILIVYVLCKKNATSLEACEHTIFAAGSRCGSARSDSTCVHQTSGIKFQSVMRSVQSRMTCVKLDARTAITHP